MHFAGTFNAALLKDFGLIPLFMHKNQNADAVIVASKSPGEFPYLNSYAKGLKLHLTDDESYIGQIKYIKENYNEIDAMLLYGAYIENMTLGYLYKTLNPKGKMYMALDANITWMDRCDTDNETFKNFMEVCDVIAASGRDIQRHLNEKWHYKIEYISNGYINYYEYHGKKFVFDFNKKENTIIYVGRVNEAQKGISTLLEAFALIADKIPDWELKIIGSVEPEFEEYIIDYNIKYPEICSRVHFIGNISDKLILFNKYAKSKVFALPSKIEGGTPNVISEALFNGNAIAITPINSCQDAVDNGKCGAVSNDLRASSFAETLLELCLDTKLEDKCRHAHEYAKRNYDMSKNADRLYEMLFGEF